MEQVLITFYKLIGFASIYGMIIGGAIVGAVTALLLYAQRRWKKEVTAMTNIRLVCSCGCDKFNIRCEKDGVFYYTCTKCEAEMKG